MWSLDIDFHTPKDLAGINNKEQILRFLDNALTKAETEDRKKVNEAKWEEKFDLNKVSEIGESPSGESRKRRSEACEGI